MNARPPPAPGRGERHRQDRRAEALAFFSQRKAPRRRDQSRPADFVSEADRTIEARRARASGRTLSGRAVVGEEAGRGERGALLDRRSDRRHIETSWPARRSGACRSASWRKASRRSATSPRRAWANSWPGRRARASVCATAFPSARSGGRRARPSLARRQSGRGLAGRHRAATPVARAGLDRRILSLHFGFHAVRRARPLRGPYPASDEPMGTLPAGPRSAANSACRSRSSAILDGAYGIHAGTAALLRDALGRGEPAVVAAQ